MARGNSNGTKSFVPIFIGLCLGVFQVALDEVVLGIAAPTITNEFRALNDIGWYGSAYLLTSSSFQLVFGRMYSFMSVKSIYLAALIIFEVGSIVCATAQTSAVFIVGRAIAGLGAGGILSGTLTIIAHVLPLPKVAAFNGIIGAVNAIAFFCGPLISGAIVGNTTWRWFVFEIGTLTITCLPITRIFYMNPIISIPTFGLILLILHLEKPKPTTWKQKLVKLNLLSAIILSAALICLLLPLQWGGTTYNWQNARIIVTFVLFGILLGVFVAMQLAKDDEGLIPRRVITERNILFGMTFSFCTSGAGFSLEYYLPIWLQAVKNRSVLSSGILLLPVISAAIVSTLTSGFLVAHIKYYVPFMYLASILLAVGIGLLTTLHAGSPLRDILGYQVPSGVGIGLALQQTVLAAQTVLAKDDIPIGLSLIVLAQTLGGTISLAACQTIFTTSLQADINHKLPELRGTNIAGSGATSLRQSIPATLLPRFLEVYNNSIVKTWYLPLGLACFSILGAAGMQWINVDVSMSKQDAKPVSSRGADVELITGAAASKEPGAPGHYKGTA